MRDAIVISGWKWNALNVPERLALSLAHAGARVLYCENPVSLWRTSGRQLMPVGKNIFRLKPKFAGNRLNAHRLFAHLQAIVLANQIMRSARCLDLKDPVFFYPHGKYTLFLSQEMKRRSFDLVHICMDYELQEQIEHVRISDVTLAIPEAAFFELRNLFGDKVCKLPQFGSPSTLRPAKRSRHKPLITPLPHFGAPSLIYLGNVEGRVDLELVGNLLRQHPDWHFISFGDGQHPSLPPNCHVLPWGDPDVLAHLCSPHCIGFLPYNCAEPKNMHCVPLKLFDYFSLGLPVVSTPISYLSSHKDLVYLGQTAQELADAVTNALEEPADSYRKSKRIAFAAEHSIENLSELLSPLLVEKKQFPPPGWPRPVATD